ncbi:MAG TPA: prolipoprotein diacylglyceryl transferase [Chryseosolibacter sp.]
MHPVLFEIGSVNIYSYGVCIAIGAIAGVWYMAVRGKKELGLAFDQANNLFLIIFIAAFVGGKLFLFFEDPSGYAKNPMKLLGGRGFVFYGSFLLAIPTMLWFFRKNKLNPYQMLDIMAITTCLVHMFGRIGCFMAGCCHGTPTSSIFGVTYFDPACSADPLNVPLHPTQLYESAFIGLVMVYLFYLRGRKKFNGQLFLTYLFLYGIGRFALEYLRGDLARGFIIEDILSHSQFIALVILAVVAWVYVRWSKQNVIPVAQRTK